MIKDVFLVNDSYANSYNDAYVTNIGIGLSMEAKGVDLSMEVKGTDETVIFPNVEKVKFYDCTTVIWWSDGTKTHVVAQEGDSVDPEKGIAMCFMKKALGNKGSFNDKLTVLLGENLQEKRRAKRKARRSNKKK